MPGNLVDQVDDWVPVQRALVSVADKTGLDLLVPALAEINPGIQFYATGGTSRHLAAILGPEGAEAHLIPVSAYTGQPETQGGLVKTLDFKIYLGLLTETYNEAHQTDLAGTGALPLDMVVCNLYPFERAVANPRVTVEEARAHIDIGGPAMIRAAAKNYLRVAAVVDPEDYVNLLEILRAHNGRLDLATRFALARKAFAHTARYEAVISQYLAGQEPGSAASAYALL